MSGHVPMKHTIKGRHGHMYRIREGKKRSLLNMEKFCISAKEAVETDLVTESLESSWRVSRRYHTCWACYEQTEEPGGYRGRGADAKVLFYECSACSLKKK